MPFGHVMVKYALCGIAEHWYSIGIVLRGTVAYWFGYVMLSAVVLSQGGVWYRCAK